MTASTTPGGDDGLGEPTEPKRDASRPDPVQPVSQGGPPCRRL